MGSLSYRPVLPVKKVKYLLVIFLSRSPPPCHVVPVVTNTALMPAMCLQWLVGNAFKQLLGGPDRHQAQHFGGKVRCKYGKVDRVA